jgi:hypothetical protein
LAARHLKKGGGAGRSARVSEPAALCMGSKQSSPDRRDLLYLKLITSRLERRPDEEVARQFDLGSPQELYEKIANDGHPICPVCGTTYVEKGHCPPPTTRRPKRGDGEVKVLKGEVDMLPFRREYLKDERFVAQEVYPDTGQVHALGAKQVPPDPLPRLIAAYAAANLNVGALVATLHHSPEEVDPDRIRRAVKDLRKAAEKLATLVRGKMALRTGRTTGELSANKQAAAIGIRWALEAGWTRGEIASSDKMRYLHKVGEENFDWLLSLNLSDPLEEDA